MKLYITADNKSLSNRFGIPHTPDHLFNEVYVLQNVSSQTGNNGRTKQIQREEEKKQKNQKHQEMLNETEEMKEQKKRKKRYILFFICWIEREKCKEERPKFLYGERGKFTYLLYEQRRKMMIYMSK